MATQVKVHPAESTHLEPVAATGPDVAVVYTNVKSTLAALRKAASLADGLHGTIRLLVPRIVPYPLPLDRPPVAEAFAARKFRTLLSNLSIETRIDFRLCRDEKAALQEALPPESVVVLGAARRWWLPTAEQRLARWLEKQGHHVLLVDCQ